MKQLILVATLAAAVATPSEARTRPGPLSQSRKWGYVARLSS